MPWGCAVGGRFAISFGNFEVLLLSAGLYLR